MITASLQAGRHYTNPGGIRIGRSEITRIGMKTGNKSEVSELIKRIIIDKEDASKVKQDVVGFRRNFQKVNYYFPSVRTAYEHIRIHWVALDGFHSPKIEPI